MVHMSGEVYVYMHTTAKVRPLYNYTGNKIMLPQSSRGTVQVSSNNTREMALIRNTCVNVMCIRYTYVYLVVLDNVHDPSLEVITSAITIFS